MCVFVFMYVNIDETHHTEESSAGLIGHSFGKQCFTSSGRTIQDDTLGRLDTHLLVVLRVGQGQLNTLLDLLDLSVQTSDVSITLCRSLLQLHDSNHWISVI